MAYGISPKLPLEHDSVDGHYVLTKTIRESVRQKMKMLILTAPGERIMDPGYGVGLRQWLFRPLVPNTFEEIATKIKKQVAMYLPFVTFMGIRIETVDQDMRLGDSGIRIRVAYSVTKVTGAEELQITEKLGLIR
tara:strand:- start:641 stop:1045 length:405 start_codon:yes stop_codon:yes gene_type:complete